MTISDIGAVALENGQLYQNMQELAIHDGLTLLFTKGHFMELLKLECKRSIRHKEPFSLLLIDIDFFKKYNDKFGHVAGDLVLKSLGNHFIDFLKENQAVISRFGGEEFCVILPQTSKKEAFEMAQSLRSSIEGLKLLLRRQQTPVTVSIGVSTFLDDTSDETELIMKADKAMYAAKKSGRNAVACA
jgi:diguanylate cyclase (GGDEF)-like protein